MNLKNDIKPVSYVKSHTADILRQINENRRPLFVTQNGEARAVIVDTESYESMQNALKILKLLSQGEKDIAGRRYADHDSFFESFENQLQKRRK